METINWQEAAKWSNDRPASFTILWDVRYERSLKYHWRKLARGLRKPTTTFVTGYSKRKINGREEVNCGIINPNFGYFLAELGCPSMHLIVNQESAEKFKDLFTHVEEQGVEVKVSIV